MAVTQPQDLRIRRVAIDTWRESVVYLHRDCAVVRAAGFQALSKVTVRADGMTISAVLNVVDDEAIVKLDELGLSEDAFVRLNVEAGRAAEGRRAVGGLPLTPASSAPPRTRNPTLSPPPRT